ncbi:hypothetical protein JTB14_027487 [Gonioctena quinquepunctata]|nr:hypothetical protein JTB14_027487 [Gonioctena quinquepunctata]
MSERTLSTCFNPIASDQDLVLAIIELDGKLAFPEDHSLKIAVWDKDISDADDLIGETKIDLEIRYFTKHRAYCGIAEKYKE